MFKSLTEVARDLADRVKTLRLDRHWTQSELAQRAGIALPTYRRFESAGLISLERLLKIAVVLDALPEFERLFRQPLPSTLDELERRATRRRGTKRARRRDAKA